jgi:hypothetical protein
LVRTLCRTGQEREGKAALERARPSFGTRDFDLAQIAGLQAEVGDDAGAAATAAAMRTDERVRYRVEIRLALAENRLKRGDRTGAAIDAREVVQASESLVQSQVGALYLPWLRGNLRERAASLLYRAGFPDEARSLWKRPNPGNDDGRQLALAGEMAVLGAIPEAEAIWDALERKGNPVVPLPVALARARFSARGAPTENIEAARKNCGGDVRRLQVLSLTCAEGRFFAEAERVAQTIEDKVERVEILRRIALLAGKLFYVY